MIYTTTKWVEATRYDYAGFKDGPEVYVTGINHTLDEHQKRRALRHNHFTDYFRNITAGNTAGITGFGTGATATFIGTGPGFSAVTNGFIVAGGSVLSLIALTFAGFGVYYGRDAYREFRAKRAELPPGVEQFPIFGSWSFCWQQLMSALEEFEKEEFNKLSERNTGERWSVGHAKSNLAVTHILLDALKNHTSLGITVDPYISNYLLTTKDMVMQMKRDDQDADVLKELKVTLLQAARREMENIYPHLYQERESMDIKVGTRATEDEFVKLTTRGEAIAAAKAAMDTVKASYSIS